MTLSDVLSLAIQDQGVVPVLNDVAAAFKDAGYKFPKARHPDYVALVFWVSTQLYALRNEYAKKERQVNK